MKTTLLKPIMLIEDNPMDIDISIQAFEEAGINNPVLVCRDGEEALQTINKLRDKESISFPALVILDLHLTKIDGVELLKIIRRDEVWENIPVIICSTSGNKSDIENAYKAGANAYLMKPADFDEFVESAALLRQFWLTKNKSPYNI
ncbi:response regulator receiver protein [Melioribacter roseus P3M-2]|uniref:Response regulator receiver protein n=1 Tax=Melioribacter roseus (strain DSM 23840 / JCM 17771 / VKM B-2668 / P3M-2) TaxID=1191523 RepID=I6ZT77_MELRP|nr:response regulator [Melioribacter roseus]AFN75249.1 response regulator receiver protein [Melioribacter roseus P3M-2]